MTDITSLFANKFVVFDIIRRIWIRYVFFNLPTDSQSVTEELGIKKKLQRKMKIIYKNSRLTQRAIFGAGAPFRKARKATQSANTDAARTGR